jgi:hypothetical protein
MTIKSKTDCDNRLNAKNLMAVKMAIRSFQYYLCCGLSDSELYTLTHKLLNYECVMSITSMLLSGTPSAAPAGEQCLNEAAAGSPSACRSSETSCHALQASSKLMYLICRKSVE